MNFFSRVWARVTTAGRSIITARMPFWIIGKTVVNEDSAMQVAAFNRGVIYLTGQIAKLPWYIKNNKHEILLDNPIYYLLNVQPNPEINAMVFRLYMMQQAIVHGNGYAEIERNFLGAPIALWPLEAQRMSPTRDWQTGKLLYQYSDPEKGMLYFNPKDIYHVRNFHMKDIYQGQSVVGYARDVLGIQIAADSMAGGLFHNSGFPSGTLEHPGKLSDAAYKRLKETWDNETGGRKSGGTKVLEEGLKFNPLKIDATTLQFLESRQFGVLEIARFLGVPPTKLFDVTAATYSNVENANLEVATDTLDTWASMFDIETDVKLLGGQYGGRYSEIDLYEIFRGDMKTRSDYFKTMFGIGSMNANEIRRREGMPGYKEGNKFFIPTNNLTPVERVDDMIDAEIEQKTKPSTAPTDPAKKKASEEAEARLLNAAIDSLTK